MSRKFIAGLALIAMLLASSLGLVVAQNTVPAATLTPIPVDGPLIVYTGTLVITPQGQISVGQYKVAPVGAFIPTVLESGKTVTIVGRLMPDNVTIQAYVIEVENGINPPVILPTFTPTPGGILVTLTPTQNGVFVTFTPTPGGPTLTPTAVSPTLTPTPVGTPDVTTELGNTGFYCRNIDTARHPVGERIANEFGVPYADVMNAFCVDRLGFGEITRIYRLAQDTDVDPAPIILDRAHGVDWAIIITTYNIDVALIDTNEIFGIIPGLNTEVERGKPIIIANDGNNGQQCQGNNGNGKGKGKCKDKDNNGNGKGKGKKK